MADAKANPTRGRQKAPTEGENPKANPDATSNRIKDPEDWVTGHEPMTGAQASYLKTLSEQAHDPTVYEPDLDKAEAAKRIDQLKQETGR
jgi:phosphohistidine phosphatase SixA